MNKFNFKFQKILEYKESIEDLNRSMYNKELNLFNDEKIKLEALVHTRETLNKQREVSVNLTTIKDLKLYSSYLEDISDRIDKQNIEVKAKERNVKIAKEKLIEAVKEKKTFEKLKEKHYNEFLYYEKKEEEKLIDQLVSFKGGTK